MRIFFKTGLAVIILFVLVVVFMPLGIGHWLDNNYSQYLQAFNKGQHNYQAKLVKFQRGWFSSTARIQLVAIGGSETIDINQTLYQGPLVFAAGKKGSLQLHFAKAYVVATSNQPNIQGQATLEISFANHIHGKVDIPFSNYSFVLHNKPASFQMKNVHFIFKTKLGKDFTKAKVMVKGNVGQFIMQDNDATPITVSLSHLYINSHLHNYQGVWFGARFVSLKKAVVTVKDKAVIDIKDAQVHLNLTHAKDKSALKLQYDIQQINAGDKIIMPVMLNISLKDLDTNALVGVVKQLMDLQNKMSSAIKQSTSKEARDDARKQVLMEQSKQLRAAALKLLEGGLTFDVDHSMKTKAGETKLAAHGEIPASHNGAFNLMSLMFKTKLSVSFSLPNQWAQDLAISAFKKKNSPTPKVMAAQYIKGLIKSKMLQQQGDNLTVQINYQQGQLKINGVPPNMQALEIKVAPPITNHKSSGAIR